MNVSPRGIVQGYILLSSPPLWALGQSVWPLHLSLFSICEMHYKARGIIDLAQSGVLCCTGPHINWRPGRTDQPGAAHACLGSLEELDNICLSLHYLYHLMPSARFCCCDIAEAAWSPIATWPLLPLESWEPDS
jgi:hypothetical protein